MKKIILILGVLILAAVILGIAFWWGGRTEDKPADKIVTAASFEECARLSGSVIMESYPRQCRTEDGKTFTENIGNELEKNDIIRVENPRPNATITSPMVVEGEARGTWFFEASFGVLLLDSAGNTLAQVPAQAKGNWMTEEFVPFEAVLTFDAPEGGEGMLVLMKANPSGLPENNDSLKIPVVFGKTESGEEEVVLQAYFSNDRLDEDENVNCEAVFPVTRKVAKTKAVGTAALEELLEGPTAEEQSEGYATLIPAGTKLLSLRIENGIAYADFSSELNPDGGSCRVTAIAGQIKQTLMQFETVEDMVISVEGETENVLQP